MGVYIEPFDFKTIFMNYFLGNGVLFGFALLIIMSVVSAKFQLSDRTYGLLMLIAVTLFAMFVGESYLIIIYIITGFILFKGMSKLITR